MPDNKQIPVNMNLYLKKKHIQTGNIEANAQSHIRIHSLHAPLTQSQEDLV